MNKVLPVIGVAAALAATSANAAATQTANPSTDQRAEQTKVQAPIPTPAFAGVVAAMAKEINTRIRVAQDFHDSNPFAKAPTFGKAGSGGGFVKFKSEKTPQVQRALNVDVAAIFSQYKPT